ncbi:amino acid permease [Candidatus Micrarchaeota archaeon]|nr:amino acid permease [Candidatus Micrarchaeota archaeon]
MVSGTNKRVLTVLTLALINVAAVANLGQLSVLAEYGLSAVFFIGLAALVFFIPTALVSAELATGWPREGGVYLWVKEAFGKGWGFLAIWLQWIENVVWYPTILSFAAATIAFIIDPSLVTNTFYTLAVILAITWGATIANFKGMQTSGLISSFGVTVGVMFPALLVIILGLVWIFTGGTTQIELNAQSIIPDLSNINNIVFLVGVLLGLAGIEMSAVHAKEVKNPQKDYPKAIFISVILILAITVLGSLAISVVVPKQDIILTAGIMEAFSTFFSAYDLQWITPIIAILISAGSVGMVSTWMVGPSKGILATARDGNLPPFFQKVNKNGMPVHLMITQACIITLLALVFIFMPSINSSYWMLTVLTAQLYLIMYVMMFASAVKLRYSQPKTKRAYTVPGGNFGIWIVAGIGILASIFAIIIGFIPPPQIEGGSEGFFQTFIIAGIGITCIVPLIIRRFKKAEWAPKRR